jgi:hypothetical protein
MDKKLLIVSGIICFIIAILHIIIVFLGSDAYVYFGAGNEMARMDREGSIFPMLSTLFIASVFGLFGFYGFSGAGVIRKLPLIKTMLLIISSLFFVRGLLFFVQLFQIIFSQSYEPVRFLFFSLLALITGIMFSIGTYLVWRKLDY